MSESKGEDKRQTENETEEGLEAGFKPSPEPPNLTDEDIERAAKAETGSGDASEMDSLWDATGAESDLDSPLDEEREPDPPKATPTAGVRQPIQGAKKQPPKAAADRSASAKDAQQAQEQLQAMNVKAMGALLEAAETAQQMVETSDRIAEQVHGQRAGLELAAAKAVRMNWITLGASAGVLLIALLIFMFMAAGLSTRVSAVDRMLTAVTERVVKMNAAVEELSGLDEMMSGYSRDQATLKQSQEQLALSLDEGMSGLQAELAATRELIATKPEPTEDAASAEAQQAVLENLEAMQLQISALQESLSKLQGGEDEGLITAMATMDKRLEQIDQRSAALARVERDLRALVTLTRERMLEALPSRASRTATEKAEADNRMLRYPMSTAPDAPGGAPLGTGVTP